MTDEEISDALLHLSRLKGAFRKKVQTTDEELEMLREKAVEQICKKFK